MNIKLFTQEEVADLLHCHVNTVAMWRQCGLLPSIKTGKNYMILEDDLIDFLKCYKNYDISNQYKALKALNHIGLKKEKER